MPANYNFRFHDDERVDPAWPQLPKRGPEEAVKIVQMGSWPLSFENGELLPKRQNLQGCLGAGPEEYSNGDHQTEEESEHERTSVAHRGVVDSVDILASRRNRVLQPATGCLDLIET